MSQRQTRGIERRLEWEARGKSRIVFVLAKQKWRPFTLCDNLQAHKAPEFVDAMKPLGEIVLFPPNVTDLLQPVDAGAGRMMKYLIASRLDNQMDNDAAFSSKWLAGRFTAPERRILITRWVGEAWEELCQAGYIRKYFEKIAYLGRLVQIPVESRSRVLMITGSSPMSPLSSTSMMSQNPPAATAVTATFLKATTISKTRVRQTRKRPSSRMKPDNPVFVKATMSRFSIPMANRYSPAVLLHRVRPYTGSLCPTATLWSLSNNCTR
ncbi:hypothetical protein PBRA_006493 [Plasmodiophora brassicae]|uniref:DDE-1 domain-containing protein n=1 Tax=Plasmodiophora brassicae TaxID=37360 RepID=A0A0G4ITA6_PLABS|nr:hypothetical protein PBRA_006493 [Plasmodiophora brassicae]